jgi:hypothetical protein
METLLLPPTKAVFETYYCPTCLKSLPASLGCCPACQVPPSPSRLKRLVQSLCRSRTKEDKQDQMLEDLPTSLHYETRMKAVSFETEPDSPLSKPHCLHQCCALCGLMRVSHEDEPDHLPLPIPCNWQCACGVPNAPDHHICSACRRTNRPLQFRHISEQVRRSLDAGFFVITEAALLLASVCRVCGDKTPFGSTLCSDCRGRA